MEQQICGCQAKDHSVYGEVAGLRHEVHSLSVFSSQVGVAERWLWVHGLTVHIPHGWDKDEMGARASRPFNNCPQTLLENIFKWTCEQAVLNLFMLGIQERSKQDTDIRLIAVDNGNQIEQGVVRDAVRCGIWPTGHQDHVCSKSPSSSVG